MELEFLCVEIEPMTIHGFVHTHVQIYVDHSKSKYGPIMYFQAGGKPEGGFRFVVFSSPSGDH